LVVVDVWIVKTLKSDSSKVLSATTSTNCPSACSSEQIIPISATGSTILTDWTIVPGSEINFNKKSYAGAKKIYFQANLSSDASDRSVYARLYDETHDIGVQGSDISTKSVTFELQQSGTINPYSGDLSLKVQIKSLNGNTATLTNPRIRVVY
jgi:hypothetical protein